MIITGAQASSNIGYFSKFKVSFRPSSSDATSDSQAKSQVHFIYRELVNLRNALEDIKNPLPLMKLSQLSRHARAESFSLLSLSKATSATLRSTEEVNATPTSFSPFGPDWTAFATSDAAPSIGGTYDGSNGSGTITFRATKGGTHGQDNIKIRVTDPNDSKIEDILIKSNDPLDTVYTLSNGLTFTLGAGDVIKNDAFTITVSDTVPTTYSPSNPVWTGVNLSDALVTLDGIYDGSMGTQTLKFEVIDGGSHGTDDLLVRVFDQGGNPIEDIQINSTDPLDKEYMLSNGITFTLGAGSLTRTDYLTISVYDSVGSVVDPDKAFNGTRNDNPNLQYGLSVTEGSFDLNGETINVYAGDSINDVISRINQSSAGVTASFDTANEQVLLTQNTAGSAATITLENDTSGFLAATKLDGATVVAGIDADVDKVMNRVAQFSSVQSGTIYINGTAVSIDVTTDSLNDVISRINASDAGVTASIDTNYRRFSIMSDDLPNQMNLDSNGTGFFPSLSIFDNVYAPVMGNTSSSDEPQRLSEAKADTIADAIQKAAVAFSALFNDRKVDGSPLDMLTDLRDDLKSAVSEAFHDSGDTFTTAFGINFDFSSTSHPVFEFSRVDYDRLVTELTSDGKDINDLFFGKKPDTEEGVIEKILSSLETTETVLKELHGSKGIFINVMA